MANIATFVRVRPLSESESERKCRVVTVHDKDSNTIGIIDPAYISNPKVDILKQAKPFSFDAIFYSDANDAGGSQLEVYNKCGKPCVDHCLDGFNCSIFAYGQTGSGKTFTMMGQWEPIDNFANEFVDEFSNSWTAGIIPRLCCDVMKSVEICKANGKDEKGNTLMGFSVFVTYYEIYNERVSDLLSQSSSSHLRVREHPIDGAYIDGITEVHVLSYQQIETLLKCGDKRRSVGSTLMNSSSSRSHAVFTLHIEQEYALSAPNGFNTLQRKGKINLIDLAGSERASMSGATGVRLREAGNINRSLSTLGDVIIALSDRSISDVVASKASSFIPYRNSLLTWLLRDSIGGNSRCTILAAISPADISFGETLSTLRFLERAKRVMQQSRRQESYTGGAAAAEVWGRLAEAETHNAQLKQELLQAQLKNQELCKQIEDLSVCSGALSAVPAGLAVNQIGEAALEAQKGIEVNKLKDRLYILERELAATNDQLSIKTIEVECISDSHSSEIARLAQEVQELKAKLDANSANESDMMREKQELHAYYNDLLIESTNIIETERLKYERDVVELVLQNVILRCESEMSLGTDSGTYDGTQRDSIHAKRRSSFDAKPEVSKVELSTLQCVEQDSLQQLERDMRFEFERAIQSVTSSLSHTPAGASPDSAPLIEELQAEIVRLNVLLVERKTSNLQYLHSQQQHQLHPHSQKPQQFTITDTHASEFEEESPQRKAATPSRRLAHQRTCLERCLQSLEIGVRQVEGRIALEPTSSSPHQDHLSATVEDCWQILRSLTDTIGRHLLLDQVASEMSGQLSTGARKGEKSSSVSSFSAFSSAATTPISSPRANDISSLRVAALNSSPRPIRHAVQAKIPQTPKFSANLMTSSAISVETDVSVDQSISSPHPSPALRHSGAGTFAQQFLIASTPASLSKPRFSQEFEPHRFDPGPNSISKALIMTKLSLAQHYADYEELQLDYRTLEKCVCEYKFRVATLLEELEEKSDEVMLLRAQLAINGLMPESN